MKKLTLLVVSLAAVVSLSSSASGQRSTPVTVVNTVPTTPTLDLNLTNTVSMSINVEAGEFADSSFFDVRIGGQSSNIDALNEMLRPAGGKTLVVTTILGSFVGSTPQPDWYHSASLVQCLDTPSVGGLGTPLVSVSGATTTSVNLQPGVPVRLSSSSFFLCFNSSGASNRTARFYVHGFLIS